MPVRSSPVRVKYVFSTYESTFPKTRFRYVGLKKKAVSWTHFLYPVISESIGEPVSHVSLVGEEVSQSQQNDFADEQPESVPQQSAATSSSVEQVDDVIVLSSDEENDFEQVTT